MDTHQAKLPGRTGTEARFFLVRGRVPHSHTRPGQGWLPQPKPQWGTGDANALSFTPHQVLSARGRAAIRDRARTSPVALASAAHPPLPARECRGLTSSLAIGARDAQGCERAQPYAGVRCCRCAQTRTYFKLAYLVRLTRVRAYQIVGIGDIAVRVRSRATPRPWARVGPARGSPVPHEHYEALCHVASQKTKLCRCA